MQTLRAGLVLIAFFCLTVPLMPVQLLLMRLRHPAARTFPHWYHRQICRILGLRIHVDGAVSGERPMLLVANHVSWLDIPVISAVAPISFVAKREVGTWPFVSWLAKLQRSVFVDRERRGAVAGTAREIIDRLHAGDNIVLFAEGTSSDGNQVLPFRTALFAAAKPAGKDAAAIEEGIFVQTLAIAYTRVHGIPLGRLSRPRIAWYGDMNLASHAWEVLKMGPLDVHIRLGEPVALADFADRKVLARVTEDRVRADVAALLYPHSRSSALSSHPVDDVLDWG